VLGSSRGTFPADQEPAFPSQFDPPIYNGYAAQNHGDHVKPYVRQSMAERRWGSPHDQHSQRPDSAGQHPGEGERSSQWTHEELVQGFRHLIDTSIQEDLRLKGERHSLRTYPALIIRNALGVQEQSIRQPGYLTNQLAQERGLFYFKIRHAWDVIAFDHYRMRDGVEDAFEKQRAADSLSAAYQIGAMGETRPEIIKLDPLQVQILDALAEAADIPHQRGQSEIEIPEKLRDFRTYNFGPGGKAID
jgi:hypothetical protein